MRLRGGRRGESEVAYQDPAISLLVSLIPTSSNKLFLRNYEYIALFVRYRQNRCQKGKVYIFWPLREFSMIVAKLSIVTKSLRSRKVINQPSTCAIISTTVQSQVTLCNGMNYELLISLLGLLSQGVKKEAGEWPVFYNRALQPSSTKGTDRSSSNTLKLQCSQ